MRFTGTKAITVPYSDEALAERARQMADQASIIRSLEEEKAAALKDFSARINARYDDLHAIARDVEKGTSEAMRPVLWEPAPRVVACDESGTALRGEGGEPLLTAQRYEMVAWAMLPPDPCDGRHRRDPDSGEIVDADPLCALARFAIFEELDRRAMHADEHRAFSQPELPLGDMAVTGGASTLTEAAKVVPIGTTCCAVLAAGDSPAEDELCGKAAPARGRMAGLCADHADDDEAANWRERREQRRGQRKGEEGTQANVH